PADLLNINNLEEPLVEEVGEKEIDFTDIPDDAKFIGENDDINFENLHDEQPYVEEILEQQDKLQNDEFVLEDEISTQDKIKEELAAIDELDEEFNTTSDEMVEKNNMGKNMEQEYDFYSLNEKDIKEALGENISEQSISDNIDDTVDHIVCDKSLVKEQSEEMVNELSKSIAQTITSSITDDTLKAALKGMNMSININISFDENKH
ncbi:hypothetical protein CINS5971_05260, partial [Campylobacter insulaenigrae]|nr:hypothetical protein [Campylobacter insulaenigrae]MCR6586925.1 hypothetical protein [Campylobacter insulaenigrae]